MLETKKQLIPASQSKMDFSEGLVRYSAISVTTIIALMSVVQTTSVKVSSKTIPLSVISNYTGPLGAD